MRYLMTKPSLLKEDIAEGRIIGFIYLSRVLALCEMQTASSRFELGSLCSFPTTVNSIPRLSLSLSLYIYIYIYIYIERERERERERQGDRDRETDRQKDYIYIYIYIYNGVS